MSGIALIVSMLLSGFGAMQQQTDKIITEESDEFKLTYMICGMGSNTGDKFPTFRVYGNQYYYTSEQNSYLGKRTLLPDSICTGIIRSSAIDSIIAFVNASPQLKHYDTNVKVMSGSINYLTIEYQGVKHEFTMHNAGNPIARQVIDILNSHIPADKDKLWVSDYTTFP